MLVQREVSRVFPMSWIPDIILLYLKAGNAHLAWFSVMPAFPCKAISGTQTLQ